MTSVLQGVVCDTELRQWLTLNQIKGVGYVTFQRLRQLAQGSIEGIFDLDTQQLAKAGLKSKQIEALRNPCERTLIKTMEWLQQQSHHLIITYDDSRYPLQLKEIARPPILLFAIGNPLHLHTPQLAIIGSRSPTVSGKETTRYITTELSECGWVITSGLALGIDSIAHKAAVDVKGYTTAVLGNGIDQIYPKRHIQLADSILACDGLIVSEFAPGTPVLAENFPRRNRIISGLSMGTLVVEAAIQSGSLITAKYAMEQGREVFAIPGNINNPVAKGCHYLIKQGAKLVEETSDINEEFQNLSFWQDVKEKKYYEKSSVNDLATDRLLDSVDFEATSVDVVAERSGLPIKVILSKLVEYELRGLVATVPGGYVKLGGK